MISIKKQIYLLTILLSTFHFLFSFLVFAQGAYIYLKTEAQNIGPGSEFIMEIFIDNESSGFNAFDLNLNYDPDLFEFTGSNDAGALTDIWQESPATTGDKIYLSGAFFKPFQGRGGKITNLLFRSLKAGSGEFSFSDSKIYLADGKGSEIILSSAELNVFIGQEFPQRKISETVDGTPPELESKIVQNPFEKNQLISFNAKDPESGVKESLIRWKNWLFWSDWEPVRNSVSIREGAWATELKVVNNSGEETIQKLYFKGEIAKKTVFVFGGLVLVIILSFLLYNKH